MKRLLIFIFSLLISIFIFSQNYYKDTFKFETEDVKCIYEYPVLKGEKYNTLNKHLKEKIFQMFENAYKNLCDASKLDTFLSNMTFYSELSCSLFSIDDTFLSIRFYNESFAGGAHPSHNFFSYNYNFKLGREFEFKDYKMKKDALKKISEYCKKEIQKQLKERGEKKIDFEIIADMESFKVFNIDKNGIYFTFNEYEILPYYLGSFTVFIPKKEFNKFIIK
ncbi:MAG: DUF3298 domain-containing protein [candidate division WOR-3 bacterium]